MQQHVATSNPLGVTAAEWQVRVDLAAAHRLAFMHGFSEGIFNHLTALVPGKPGRYYQIPFGWHWSEVTASSFMEVDFDGRVLAGEGEPERSAICIHAPMHRLAPHAACVFHTHMPFASALTRLEDPTILPIGQTEAGIASHIAYDRDFPGPAFDPAEMENAKRYAKFQIERMQREAELFAGSARLVHLHRALVHPDAIGGLRVAVAGGDDERGRGESQGAAEHSPQALLIAVGAGGRVDPHAGHHTPGVADPFAGQVVGPADNARRRPRSARLAGFVRFPQRCRVRDGPGEGGSAHAGDEHQHEARDDQDREPDRERDGDRRQTPDSSETHGRTSANGPILPTLPGTWRPP